VFGRVGGKVENGNSVTAPGELSADLQTHAGGSTAHDGNPAHSAPLADPGSAEYRLLSHLQQPLSKVRT
jgi:hypothetical protein